MQIHYASKLYHPFRILNTKCIYQIITIISIRRLYIQQHSSELKFPSLMRLRVIKLDIYSTRTQVRTIYKSRTTSLSQSK